MVATGPVGIRRLGLCRLFRYEVRCARGGVIPDIGEAVASPVVATSSPTAVVECLDVVADAPLLTWGRDELGVGDMWNSNSLVSWLLVGAGLDPDVDAARPPLGGRAPGWATGLAVAAQASPVLTQ